MLKKKQNILLSCQGLDANINANFGNFSAGIDDLSNYSFKAVMRLLLWVTVSISKLAHKVHLTYYYHHTLVAV